MFQVVLYERLFRDYSERHTRCTFTTEQETRADILDVKLFAYKVTKLFTVLHDGITVRRSTCSKITRDAVV